MKYLSHRQALGVLLCGAAVLSAPVANAVEINLRAEKTSITMPDGKTVEMWGLIEADADGNALAEAKYGYEGANLVVPPGDDQLVVNLFNALDVSTSLVLPGQSGYQADGDHASVQDGYDRTRATSFVKETSPGATGVYQWDGVKAGTFLLHSGSHPALQVQMGLFSPMVHQAAANEPYAGVQVSDDRQVTLLFSEVDSRLHDAVQAGTYGPLVDAEGNPTGNTMSSAIHSRGNYFMINGQAWDPASPLPAITLGGESSDRTLLRMLNSSSDYHMPTVDQNRMSLIAEDGGLYAYPRKAISAELDPLKTLDALIYLLPGDTVVYDRRMGLANGTQSDGGMMAAIQNHGTQLADVWGIECNGISWFSSGILTYDFTIVDANKAVELARQEIQPKLVCVESGVEIAGTLDTSKIGSVQGQVKAQNGEVYHVSFNNTARQLKRGEMVAVQVGDFLTELMVVQ